jgi:hypothetical protein
MDDQAAAGDVEHPVVGDAGSGVKGGFDGEVEPEGGVGDFNDEVEVARLRETDWNPEAVYSRVSTMRSGTGSFVGLSSGATSIGASALTRRAPKI